MPFPFLPNTVSPSLKVSWNEWTQDSKDLSISGAPSACCFIWNCFLVWLVSISGGLWRGTQSWAVQHLGLIVIGPVSRWLLYHWWLHMWLIFRCSLVTMAFFVVAAAPSSRADDAKLPLRTFRMSNPFDGVEYIQHLGATCFQAAGSPLAIGHRT